MEDVAAFAGVSRSTASRALNDDAYVSAAAREKVLAAARDLGYSPNQAARSLVTRRTGAVAVVRSGTVPSRPPPRTAGSGRP
ncbi:LacI family DNA-binding transcriptional regulator, partial [Amycolatopsis mediterranei]|uniref:LacI family DNA-binding transcriptional regulator n=1 Tax=Amycolatopsis mediterranei TaxID=33910 RepID=UPI003331CE09